VNYCFRVMTYSAVVSRFNRLGNKLISGSMYIAAAQSSEINILIIYHILNGNIMLPFHRCRTINPSIFCKSGNKPSFSVKYTERLDYLSSVGIATGYGLDGSGIESLWGRDFPHLSIPAL
jgi:hypothetical protein